MRGMRNFCGVFCYVLFASLSTCQYQYFYWVLDSLRNVGIHADPQLTPSVGEHGYAHTHTGLGAIWDAAFF